MMASVEQSSYQRECNFWAPKKDRPAPTSGPTVSPETMGTVAAAVRRPGSFGDEKQKEIKIMIPCGRGRVNGHSPRGRAALTSTTVHGIIIYHLFFLDFGVELLPVRLIFCG